ncbi:MAG: 6,7-dimethyl-8-ribityllumazine synthase [Planctomycetes bacterium]|nr:6,7-dimethyl-8-ribityllumazine synthase [Planctomycetota bacterium]
MPPGSTSPTVFEGRPVAPRARVAIAVARYNETITSRLLAGALGTLAKHGVPDGQIEVVWVPGAFELPVVAARLASGGQHAAVICLGAVIRGETTHDEHINRSISHQFADISVRTGVPVLFGVLTVNSLEQALQRAGGTVGNKGSECAEAALQLVDLLAQLPPTKTRSTAP